LLWGAGNFNNDPQFVGLATNNYRLRAGSLCIDAGTNVTALATNFSVSVTNDYDGVPRPLDGNGDGQARFDIGAFEFLLASADSNGDGIPDGWTWGYGLNPTDATIAAGDPDDDSQNTFDEWVADTNPTNASSYFRIETIADVPPVTVQFLSSSNRQYTLYYSADLVETNTTWTNVAGQTGVFGNGSLNALTDTNTAPARFYRVGVKVP
jgi:hypothetical protein